MPALFEPRVRVYVGGTWQDVTESGDVRQTDPIRIDTGTKDESPEVNPGTCQLTFDNPDGKFTPRNYLSPFAGSLNRATPMAVLLDEMIDTFGRVVASGWSTTDTGDTYSTFGAGGVLSGTDYSVDGTHGKHSIPAVASFRATYLGAASGVATFHNGEILVEDVRLPFANVTGGPVEPGNVLLRLQSISQYYQVRVTVEADESVKIGIYRDSSTVLTAAVTVMAAGSYTGQGLNVIGGAYDDVIYGIVYDPATTARPTTWQVSATDSTYGYGYFGIRSGVASTNTNALPIVVSYGKATYYPSQFNGEINDWPQEFSDDGKDAIVPVEAAGILQRLRQGRARTKSSLRRFYEDEASPAPAYFVPMDEGELATSALATIPATGGLPFTVISTGLGAYVGVDTSTEKHFGQGKIGSWLDPSVVVFGISEELVNNQDTSRTVATVGTTWTVDFIRAGGAGTSGVFGIVEFEAFGALTSGIWNVLCSVTDDLITISGPSGAFVALTASTLTHKAFDGAPHHFRLVATNSGSNIAWKFYLDGVQEATGTETGRQVLDIGSLYYAGQELLTPQPTTAIGPTAVFTSDASLQLATLITRMNGTTQEMADERFERLCNENGIRNFVTTSAGVEMGPQFRDTLTKQFEEIVATDGGIMRELLSARALHYDPLALVTNRAVTATIDVGAGQLNPAFRPVDDPQNLRNKITAYKRNGGQYTYELTTGRLGTADPKDGGAGVYDDEVHANPYSENQLPRIAQREVARGTVDESRFPVVEVDLSSDAIRLNLPLRRSLLNVTVGSRIKLTNMVRWNIYGDADLLVVGLHKTITRQQLVIRMNCVPFAPYRVFTLGTDRLTTRTSTLTSGIAASGVATFSVTTSSGPVWITTATHPTHFPLDIEIGSGDGVVGEKVTISGITGATSPQTFTVATRSVNGLVAAHLAGASVQVADVPGLG